VHNLNLFIVLLIITLFLLLGLLIITLFIYLFYLSSLYIQIVIK